MLAFGEEAGGAAVHPSTLPIAADSLALLCA